MKLQVYKTVKKENNDEFIEKKSRFIGYVKPVKTSQEALEFIGNIKNIHKDATHNVYAYIIKDEGVLRYSDDGEPSGTAGVPVLDVLQKSEITDVAVVVTRYFGGTLLGAGGLVRAYSHGAKIAIESGIIVTMSVGKRVKIYTDYNTIGKVLYELGQRGLEQENSEYTDEIVLTITVPIDDVESLENKITEISSGKSKVEVVAEVYYQKVE